MACRDVASLAELVQQHRGSREFDYVKASAALVTLARLRPGEGSKPNVSRCLAVLVAAATPHLAACKGRGLASMAHSLAKVIGEGGGSSADVTQFIEQLLHATTLRLPTFDPQALSNIIYAFAILHNATPRFTPPPHLVEQLLMEATKEHAATPTATKLAAYTEQELSNTLWSLAKLRHHAPQFVDQLLPHAITKLPTLLPQHLSNLLWSLATLNHQNPTFVDLLLPRFFRTTSKLNAQDLGNAMWALCILQHDEAAAVQPMLSKAVGVLLSSSSRPTAENLRQAHAYLVAREAAGHISVGRQADPEYRRLRDTGQAAWAAQQNMHAAVTSSTQQDVLQAVRRLPGCADASSEHLTEDGLFSIDVALHLPGNKKVALEVDGLTHFMSNAPSIPTGNTVLRNHMLELRGWTVVSISTREWQQRGKLPDAVERQRSYLIEQLCAAGVELPLSGV